VGLLAPRYGTQAGTSPKTLLRSPCTEGGESQARRAARFLMDLVFQWLAAIKFIEARI